MAVPRSETAVALTVAFLVLMVGCNSDAISQHDGQQESNDSANRAPANIEPAESPGGSEDNPQPTPNALTSKISDTLKSETPDRSTPVEANETIAESAPPTKDSIYRTWTDTTGKFKTEARFIEINGNAVFLEKRGGKKIDVPLSRLSLDDRSFLATQVGEAAATPDSGLPITIVSATVDDPDRGDDGNASPDYPTIHLTLKENFPSDVGRAKLRIIFAVDASDLHYASVTEFSASGSVFMSGGAEWFVSGGRITKDGEYVGFFIELSPGWRRKKWPSTSPTQISLYLGDNNVKDYGRVVDARRGKLFLGFTRNEGEEVGTVSISNTVNCQVLGDKK